MRAKLESLACALLLGGCSLALDPDKVQCTTDVDCGVFNDKPIYACVNNFCEPFSCQTDSECSTHGNLICESESCVAAQCTKNEECSGDGQLCVQGRCGDPVFGCFNQKMPLTSDAPASLQLKLLAYGDQMPVKNLVVKVCSAADLACNSPIKATTIYDTETGQLTISGLQNGTRYALRFSGQDSSGFPLMDAEYYMQRPVVGMTVEAEKLELISEDLVGALAFAASAEWNPSEGLVLAQTFGCDLRPLAGVSLADNKSAFPFYLTGVATADASETDSMGVGGFVNMEVGATGNALQHKLTFSYRGMPMFSFAVAPRPRVVTFVQVYMGDYGTTIDRSDNAPVQR